MSNMLLSPISSDLPLLTLSLPTTRFNRNSTVRRPSSGGDGSTATVITDLSPPPAVVPATGDAAVVTVAAPAMAEEEQQIAAPLLPFPFPFPGAGGTAEQGLDRDPLEGLVIMVKPNEDIINSLEKLVKQKGVFILGASGMVSYVEFLNQQDAPVENTTLQGTFEIISLDGNIELPKKNGKNQENWLTVLVADGKNSQVRGGPARRLIAGSNVQIVVGTISASMESMGRQEYLRRPELLHFPNYRNRDWLTTEVVNQIHKVTLKELNINETTNTPSGGEQILA